VGEAVKKDDEEETLVPVGPGAEGLPEAKKADEPERDADEEDERLAQKDDDEEEADRPSARKKESARERRERAKKARDRERLELNFYAKRNEELEKRLMAIEGRTAQNETAAVDQRITAIQTQILNADRVLAEALKKPNGAGAEEFVEAQRIRDQLRDQLASLNTTKQAHERRSKAETAERESYVPEATAPVAKKPDPRVVRNAKAWAEQHDWFDFSGTDEDSGIVRALDESLAAEGYDPTTEEYWEELTARVKRRLPERFKSGARARADEDEDVGEDEKPRQKAGPKFSASGKERPLKKNEVYVSAERKQAMKDYGVWDDPVARNRMLSRYAKFDAETSASKQS
jgi:hypothetical protein